MGLRIVIKEIAHIFDVLGLLQEARGDGIFGRGVASFGCDIAQAEEIFQEGLFGQQGLVDGLDWVDLVVRPCDSGGGDIGRGAAATALDEIAFEPHGIPDALGGSSLLEPARYNERLMWTNVTRNGRTNSAKPCKATLARAQSALSLRKKD